MTFLTTKKELDNKTTSKNSPKSELPKENKITSEPSKDHDDDLPF